MAFPTSPTNGQSVVINSINYVYSSADNAWKRAPTQFDPLIVGNIVSNNKITGAEYYFSNGTRLISGTYGNSEVAAYMSSYYTYANANAAAQSSAFNTLDANVGSYQVWANANLATQTTNFNTLNSSFSTLHANVGAYEIWSNANAASQATSINTLNANLGAYQIWSNANAASQASAIATLQTQVYSNVNTSAYLAGNIVVGNVRTDGYLFANGEPFSGSWLTVRDEGTILSTAVNSISFTGAGVVATASGNDITVAITGGGGGGGGGGGITYTASNTAPSGPTTGDQWYKVSEDILYEFVNDGTSYYWLDTIGPGLAGNATPINESITTYLLNQPSVTLGGNIIQKQEYYETYGNITNTGGNLSCDFNLGSVFYVTSLTANVTASFTNLTSFSNSVTSAAIIIDQGATPYRISNIQINSVNQTIKWIGATAHTGTASNTDIVSFSFVYLGDGNYRVLGQFGSYG